MYIVGDHVQFGYELAHIHGIIVPFNGQCHYDQSGSSYLIELKGFVDPTLDDEGLRYYGWPHHTVNEAALYLWIDRMEPSLTYYHPPLPPRPVSPVFYMVKEAT